MKLNMFYRAGVPSPIGTLSVSPRCTDLLVYGINGVEGATVEVI
jgi:hypothetical protein